MKNSRVTVLLAICFALFGGLIGCAPEVGSEAWCKSIEGKAKGDVTVNEATDYAKHCIFRKK